MTGRISAALALALLFSSARAVAVQELAVGAIAPAIEGKTWFSKDGKAPDLKGKVYLVDFWFAG